MAADAMIRPASRVETISQPNPGLPATRTIGTLVLERDEVIRRSESVAAWWADVEVPAGTYDVTSNGYFAFVALEGICVSAYSPPMFAGLPIGEGPPQYDQHRDVGQRMRIVRQPYLYEVAFAMADPSSLWTPAPGIEVVLVGWGVRPQFGLVDHR